MATSAERREIVEGFNDFVSIHILAAANIKADPMFGVNLLILQALSLIMYLESQGFEMPPIIIHQPGCDCEK